MNKSKLREDAPKIRTPEDLYRKYEQVLDAAERGELDQKQVSSINATLKAMKELGLDLPMRMITMIQKSRAQGMGIPRPRGEMIRSLIGITDKTPRQDDEEHAGE